MISVPRRFERLAASADDQQRRPGGHGFGAASNGGIGDREGCASVEVSLLVVEVEDRFSFEEQVKLLLAAHAFVVFFDQDLIGSVRDKQVDPNVSMPSACWSGYQTGSSASPSETVGTEVIRLTVQRVIPAA